MKASPKHFDWVYAIVLDWPANNVLMLGAPATNPSTNVTMLGYSKPLQWHANPSGRGLNITMPALNPSQLPCKWAWVIKIISAS